MLPEVYQPVIDLLISLLTALRRIYKPVIDNVIHKMIESNLDFYLEEITESSRNKRIKIKNFRVLVESFIKKDHDEPCDSNADYDSDPDSENEPEFDCYPDSE